MAAARPAIGVVPSPGGDREVAGDEVDPAIAAFGWDAPAGRALALPGRGRTFVREVPGPPGAPVVVLLHGLGGTAGLNWYAAFASLGEHFRVVSLDLRGHGRGVRDGRRFRLVDCADDVVACADALGIERFLAVGYSMGGPIAQLVWQRHPERVDGLVLCATSRNFRGSLLERFQFAALGPLTIAARPQPPALLRQLVAGVASLELGGAMPGGWVRDELDGHHWARVVEAAAALGRFSSHPWADRIDVPTSVVVTARDRLVPVHRQIRLAQQIPAATVHLVDGDHLVAVRQPDRFVPVLRAACEQVASRAAARRRAADRHGRGRAAVAPSRAAA